MGCGDCQSKIDALQQRVVDLEAVLDELRTEYLGLCKDFDELTELVDGKAQEDEDE